MDKDAIIVISGGMDSVTMLYDYIDEIAMAVSFDYGSNHNKQEIECASHHCNKLGVKHLVIPLVFMGEYFKSSLLDGADAIPEGNYADTNMLSTVVPFRNGIMLAVACGLAESNGLKRVMLANHFGDHAIYPDCRADFAQAISEAMRLGTYDNITLYAPYTSISKSDIACRGKALEIDYTQTYSCYKGEDNHCGKCATCIERKAALAEAEIIDKTIYNN